MLNFGASKPSVKGGLGPCGPLDLYLHTNRKFVVVLPHKQKDIAADLN